MVRTQSKGGRERGSLADVARRMITIKEPAERQARKASLRGGHFNIVQIGLNRFALFREFSPLDSDATGHFLGFLVLL
jgi:hypothetical protein